MPTDAVQAVSSNNLERRKNRIDISQMKETASLSLTVSIINRNYLVRINA